MPGERLNFSVDPQAAECLRRVQEYLKAQAPGVPISISSAARYALLAGLKVLEQSELSAPLAAKAPR